MKKSTLFILILIIVLIFPSIFPPYPTGSIHASLKQGFMLAESSSDKGIIDTFFGSKDTQPPNIQIKDWKDNPTVYIEKIYISGQVFDDNKITDVAINQVPIMEGVGQHFFFSHLAELKEGKNTIIIEARDEAGNSAKKEITVTRKVPAISQLPKAVLLKRMRLAVFAFDQKGIVSETSSLFQEMLTPAFVNRNRFLMVERESLDRVLEEQKLSSTKLIDKDTAVNLGKLVAAQAIIIGSIIETPAGIEVVGRMIDTETAEILKTEKVFCNAGDLKAMNFLAAAMAVKFHNDFPLLAGIVITRKGNHIFTDLGEGKISLHRRLIVYREKDANGNKLSNGENVILGYARVTQVLPDMSKAELISGSMEEIKDMDKVIPQ